MKVLFSRICISTQKIHQLSIHHSVLEIRQILESWRPEWPHLIFDHAHSPIFFNQLSISMNLHQHAKNQAVSSFYSRVTVDLKILHSDWSRAFWYISQEPDFSIIWYTSYLKVPYTSWESINSWKIYFFYLPLLALPHNGQPFDNLHPSPSPLPPNY